MSIKKYGLENFTKAILYNFDNKLDMLKKESELVNKEFIKRKDTYNIIEGGVINTKGFVAVKDKTGNTFSVSVNDQRYLSGELVATSKGFVTVKDKDDNYFCIPISDTKYMSGDLVHVRKGTTVAKDKNGNYFCVPSDDLRIKSGELVGTMTGIKHTEETKKKIGKANSIHQKGNKNSQYGTCWIYNVELKENKKIKVNDLQCYLNSGWIVGRRLK